MKYVKLAYMRILSTICISFLMLLSCESTDQVERIKELEQENEELRSNLRLREKLANDKYFLLLYVTHNYSLIDRFEEWSLYSTSVQESLIPELMPIFLDNANSILKCSNDIMSTNIEVIEGKHAQGYYNHCNPQILFFHLIENQRTKFISFIAYDSKFQTRTSNPIYLNLLNDITTISKLEEYPRFVELQKEQQHAYEKYLAEYQCDSLMMEDYENRLEDLSKFQRHKEMDELSDSTTRALNNGGLRIDDFLRTHQELFDSVVVK